MVETDEQGRNQFLLIDFGFADKYLEANNEHIKSSEEQKESFKGNILFSSLDQMNFKVTSRRDDMISLCYILFYLLNELEIPGMSSNDYLSLHQNQGR